MKIYKVQKATCERNWKEKKLYVKLYFSYVNSWMIFVFWVKTFFL